MSCGEGNFPSVWCEQLQVFFSQGGESNGSCSGPSWHPPDVLLSSSCGCAREWMLLLAGSALMRRLKRQICLLCSPRMGDRKWQDRALNVAFPKGRL